MIINRANLNALYTGFRVLFNDAFAATPSVVDQLATMVPSNDLEEKYPWMGMTTKFREWVGDRHIQNLEVADWAIKNKPFENTVGIEREYLEYDRYGVFKPVISQLGEDARLHPDELLFSVLSSGFTAKCYDGKAFFATDHPVGEVTYSNYGGGAAEAWFLFDTSRVVKPFLVQKARDYKFISKDREEDDNVFTRRQFVYGADGFLNVGFGLPQMAYASHQTLDATAYAAARKSMRKLKAANGRPLSLMPNLLVVGPTSEAAARALLEVRTLPEGGDNPWYNSAKLLVTGWLE